MPDDQGLQGVAATLEELLAWTRVQGFPKAKEALSAALLNDVQKRIYQASTGASSKAISETLGVSDSTVREVWRKAYRLGVMQRDRKVEGRFLRSFDLGDFDLLPSDPTNGKAKPIVQAAKDVRGAV